MAEYFVHNAEKLAAYIPNAIREIVGEERADQYRLDGDFIIAGASHHMKGRIRRIIEKAEEDYLKEHGKLYRVEFSGSYDVYAESEEQAEYIARGKLDMCCLNAYTEELCN